MIIIQNAQGPKRRDRLPDGQDPWLHSNHEALFQPETHCPGGTQNMMREYIMNAFQHPKVSAPVRKSLGNAGKAGDKVGPSYLHLCMTSE